LPQDAGQMLKISGVGDVKFEKYGADFLEAINDYCEAKQLSSRIELKTPKRERKTGTRRNADGSSTYEITLAMFQRGESIAGIAAERQLSHSTIEAHLSRFLASGEIGLTDIVAVEKVDPISQAILQFKDSFGVGAIKEFLGEQYSYGEIHAVMAVMGVSR